VKKTNLKAMCLFFVLILVTTGCETLGHRQINRPDVYAAEAEQTTPDNNQAILELAAAMREMNAANQRNHTETLAVLSEVCDKEKTADETAMRQITAIETVTAERAVKKDKPQIVINPGTNIAPSSTEEAKRVLNSTRIVYRGVSYAQFNKLRKRLSDLEDIVQHEHDTQIDTSQLKPGSSELPECTKAYLREKIQKHKAREIVIVGLKIVGSKGKPSGCLTNEELVKNRLHSVKAFMESLKFNLDTVKVTLVAEDQNARKPEVKLLFKDFKQLKKAQVTVANGNTP
jgi:hypothetical protein